MDNKRPKNRRFVFTIHNYTPEELVGFHALAESCDKHGFICYGLEIAPDTGTLHIQGYIEVRSAQRFPFLHKYFGFMRNDELLKFHIEIALGTAEDNQGYTKKEGGYFEFGEPVTQGTRTDLIQIKKEIFENPKNFLQIIIDKANNYQQLKFIESITPYAFSDRDMDNPPTALWIFGSSGIGKTRLVAKTFKDICYVSSYKWLGTNYRQNECFFLDDFREYDLPFNILLKITDCFPFTLEFKGSQIPLNSPFVIITSPKCIADSFLNTSEDIKQLQRRMIEINLDSILDIHNIDLRNLDKKYIWGGDNIPNDNF